MDKVKEMVDAGVSVPTAIKEVLGIRLSEFAKKHNLNATTLRMQVYGHVRANDETVAALAAELGGTEHDWRMLLWEAGRPTQPATS